MRAYERKQHDPRNEAINRLLQQTSVRSKFGWVYPALLAIWSLINLLTCL